MILCHNWVILVPADHSHLEILFLFHFFWFFIISWILGILLHLFRVGLIYILFDYHIGFQVMLGVFGAIKYDLSVNEIFSGLILLHVIVHVYVSQSDIPATTLLTATVSFILGAPTHHHAFLIHALSSRSCAQRAHIIRARL